MKYKGDVVHVYIIDVGCDNAVGKHALVEIPPSIGVDDIHGEVGAIQGHNLQPEGSSAVHS